MSTGGSGPTAELWERVMPWVDEAIGSIPPALRDAVVLRHLHGLSPGEAARALGCSVSAASRRIARGLEALRDRLRQRGVDVDAPALAAAFDAAPHVAAPAGFVDSVLAVCTGRAPVSDSVSGLLKGVEKAVFWKASVAVTALALLAMPFLNPCHHEKPSCPESVTSVVHDRRP
jgi:hypothetical protein